MHDPLTPDDPGVEQPPPGSWIPPFEADLPAAVTYAPDTRRLYINNALAGVVTSDGLIRPARAGETRFLHTVQEYAGVLLHQDLLGDPTEGFTATPSLPWASCGDPEVDRQQIRQDVATARRRFASRVQQLGPDGPVDEARPAADPIDALTAIDRAVAALCPCGAKPAPGSAYCGDDCRPSTRGADTVSDIDGTPMRWRPDLVTAVDDTGLRLLEGAVRVNGLWRQTYERDGTDLLHLRVHDDHRWVGRDVPAMPGATAQEQQAAQAPVWAALEAEMGNTGHLVGKPNRAAGWERSTAASRRDNAAGRTWAYRGDHAHWAPATPGLSSEAVFFYETIDRAARTVGSRLVELQARMASAWGALFCTLPEMIEAMEGIAELVPSTTRCSRHDEAGDEPTDPRERALWLRRNRNTGPQQRLRAPRSITPRRAR